MVPPNKIGADFSAPLDYAVFTTIISVVCDCFPASNATILIFFVPILAMAMPDDATPLVRD
jgi:hypothetical protein